MDKQTEDLIFDVCKGNPGALRVVMELMWFTDWFKMMQWCKIHLAGANLWIKYKDELQQDSMSLGYWIQEQMRKEKDGNSMCRL